MKTVRGTNRSYQLVQKTKKRDIDGVIYLVAGERNLWVKLLKDKSQQKEMEVRKQIVDGYGPLFEVPLDVVMDASGFIGYTFIGREMEIVPVREERVHEKRNHTEIPDMESRPRKEKMRHRDRKKYPDNVTETRRRGLAYGGVIVWLGLILCGLILFALNYFWFNTKVWQNISGYVSWRIVEGCMTFSLHGIVPGIVGIASVIQLIKHISIGSIHVGKAIILECICFFISILITDIIITLAAVLVIAVCGTVQQYMSSIITFLVLIFLAKSLLKRR